MEDSSKLKTPVSVLQEMMTKMGLQPEYELVAQTGPAHSTVFEFRCMAYGAVVVGSARSKKEAKQQAARLMLNALSQRGVPVPPSHAAPPATAPAPAAPAAAPSATAVPALPGAAAAASAPALPEARTHVALLRELCEQYNLGAPEYDLVSDTGPAHMREFRQRARVGAVFREASASTKKQARQDAARQLYAYLRVRLARLTTDFVENLTGVITNITDNSVDKDIEMRTESIDSCEKKRARCWSSSPICSGSESELEAPRAGKRGRGGGGSPHSPPPPPPPPPPHASLDESEEALARAHERAMERYAQLREDSAGAGAGGWRPDLGQRIADYHLGLATHTEVQKRAEALRAVESAAGGEGECAGAETALAAACAALGLTAQWSQLERGAAGAVGVGARGEGPLVVVTLEPGAPPLVLAGAHRAAAARAALRCLALALRPRPGLPSHA